MRNMKTDTSNKGTTVENTARILFVNSSISPSSSYGRVDPLNAQICSGSSDLNNYLTIGNMETTTTHINIIDDEDEKDPLALDTSSGERSSTEDSLGSAPSTSKHSHSLR